MFFLVDSESAYSFLWFRKDKSSDMRHLFTTLDGTIEETFKIENRIPVASIDTKSDRNRLMSYPSLKTPSLKTEKQHF